MGARAFIPICCSLVVAVAFATCARAQESTTPEQGSTQQKSVTVLYTGKLLGYYRTPILQPGNNTRGCAVPIENGSEAAKEFARQVQQRKMAPGAILVGTGDNFSPEYGARVFNPAPSDPLRAPNHFAPGNKELYDWDETSDRWVPATRRPPNTTLDNTLASGNGTIPTDNVACFLARAGYSAVVPGKHDFYFGAERLRQIARFMAGISAGGDYQPVQMLGANLIIQTSWRKDHKPLSDKEDPPSFIPGMPDRLKLTNLKDGNSVYPWFQGPRVKLIQLGEADEGNRLLQRLQEHGRFAAVTEFETFIHKLMQDNKAQDPTLAKVAQAALDELKPLMTEDLFLCQARDGDPNDLSSDPPHDCKLLKDRIPQLEGTQLELEFHFPEPQDWEKFHHFSTVLPGENYGICVRELVAAGSRGKSAPGFACLRFSVYLPFFLYPSEAASGKHPGKAYTDPEPFALIPASSGRPNDVAIFGVVDMDLGEYVGVLNFSWLNTDNDNVTQVKVQDPAEALRQQLDYFERKYYLDTRAWFKGMKILLAQMSPQRARVLAERVPEFHVVVSAADEEQDTVGAELKVVSSPQSNSTRRMPTFYAVPRPHFDTEKQQEVVQVGIIELSTHGSNSWKLHSARLGPTRMERTMNPATRFWNQVATILPRCLPDGYSFPSNVTKRDQQIQVLSLCLMQKETGADVVLMQKRDFFLQSPDVGDAPDKVQEILDRIIWKGDFLTLLYVPGSALKKAMEQSKKYEAEESASLSLADERGRTLVTLGIRYDPDRKEYLINQVPLDPGRLYAVATSDYIGAGDTGYPDLAASATHAPTTPQDFDENLSTISSIVCRGLYPDDADLRCLGDIERDFYLDAFSGDPTDSRQGDTIAHQLWAWSVFDHPHPVPASSKQPSTTLDKAALKSVEQRPLWDFVLKKLSLGITTLGHNGTDADIDSKFGSISKPSANAHRSTEWASAMQFQATRTWQHYQMFVVPGYDYDLQFTGVPNSGRKVSQITNLATLDFGFLRMWPGRGPDHRDAVFTAHFETPLRRPFIIFPLASTTTLPSGVSIPDQLSLRQDHSYSLQMRVGFRWQRRISSIEFGPEGGHEWNALNGFQFFTNGVMTVECRPDATTTFADCVKAKSKGMNPTITKDSDVKILELGRYHSGAYWKFNLTVPFHTKVSYTLTDIGEFFFVNFGTDNQTDTRFFDYSKHQLNFQVFPSFSIGPEVDLLFYENKRFKNFLRQDKLMLTAQFSFDLFNHRKPTEQIKYKPPAKSQ